MRRIALIIVLLATLLPLAAPAHAQSCTTITLANGQTSAEVPVLAGSTVTTSNDSPGGMGVVLIADSISGRVQTLSNETVSYGSAAALTFTYNSLFPGTTATITICPPAAPAPTSTPANTPTATIAPVAPTPGCTVIDTSEGYYLDNHIPANTNKLISALAGSFQVFLYGNGLDGAFAGTLLPGGSSITVAIGQDADIFGSGTIQICAQQVTPTPTPTVIGCTTYPTGNVDIGPALEGWTARIIGNYYYRHYPSMSVRNGPINSNNTLRYLIVNYSDIGSQFGSYQGRTAIASGLWKFDGNAGVELCPPPPLQTIVDQCVTVTGSNTTNVVFVPEGYLQTVSTNHYRYTWASYPNGSITTSAPLAPINSQPISSGYYQWYRVDGPVQVTLCPAVPVPTQPPGPATATRTAVPTRTPTSSPTSTATGSPTSTASATITPTPVATRPPLQCPVADSVNVPVVPQFTFARLTAGVQFGVAGAPVWINIGQTARELPPGVYTWDGATTDYAVYSLTSPASLWLCTSSPTPAGTPTGTPGPTLTVSPPTLGDDPICVAVTVAPTPIQYSMPDLSISIPTLRPLTTETITVTASPALSTTAIIAFFGTVEAGMQTPAAAIETASAGYSWQAGADVSATSVIVAAPALEWLAVLNPQATAWQLEGGPLWALSPLIMPVLPIFIILFAVLFVRFLLFVIGWLLKLFDVVIKLIELIPGE